LFDDDAACGVDLKQHKNNNIIGKIRTHYVAHHLQLPHPIFFNAHVSNAKNKCFSLYFLGQSISVR
jgi:hypothetical protein